MASNPLIQHGAVQERPTRFAPIFTNRFFTGLWTQRNPLRDAATPYLYEKFYSGSRYESLIGGINSEISNRLTIIRRPGLTKLNTAFTSSQVNRFYSFRKFTGNTETIQLFADVGSGTGSGVYDVTPPSTTTSIFNKTAAATSTYFQSVGNVMYFGDGAEVKKYIQTNPGWAVQNWGIGLSNGIVVAGAGTGASTGGGAAWSNPSAVTSASSFATTIVTATTNSQALVASNYGFSITTTAGYQMTGFVVYVQAYSAGTSTITARLMCNGVPVGTPKTFTVGTSVTGINLGNLVDLWGFGNWTPGFVNQSNFGVQFIATGMTTNIQDVQISAYYDVPPTATFTGSGSLTTTTGWKYVVCYGNSYSGEVSNPTPIAAVGPFTNAASVTVNWNANLDTQVNQVRLFRTTDGGSIFFEHPASPFPNTTTSYSDSTPDLASSGANNLNLFSQAPTGQSNTPPPAGLINLVYHNNRMWGSQGNTVYYSLPPNFNIGVGVSSFPPLNSFVYPSLVKKLVSTTVGLLVFTLSDIYIILGNGTGTPAYYDAPFAYKIGLASYDALTVSGTIILMMSSAGEVLKFDPVASINALTGLPSGSLDKEQVGFPIGDVLQNTYNPAASFVTWHHNGSLDQALYVGDGSVGWYRWVPTTIPEGTAAWSPQAQIVGGTNGPLQSTEVSPGQYQLLTMASSYICFRDLTTYQDIGTPYPWHADVGNIVLAQPGTEADVDFITVDYNITNGGLIIGVGALWDEITGTFELFSSPVTDPTYLVSSLTVPGRRYYFANGNPQVGRHMQVRFYGGTTNSADELLTYTIYGGVRGEK